MIDLHSLDEFLDLLGDYYCRIWKMNYVIDGRIGAFNGLHPSNCSGLVKPDIGGFS